MAARGGVVAVERTTMKILESAGERERAHVESLGFGYAANEAALYHKDTKTLALTDALVNVPSAPPPVFVTDGGDNLRGIGDDARRSSSLGHLILQGASAVNWRGSAAEAVEELWSATDAAGGAQGGAAAQLQRGWERDALLSLFFGPSPASIVDPAPSFALLAGISAWLGLG